MTEFKYLGTVLCNHGNMEVEIKERAVKGRQVMVHWKVLKERSASVEVKDIRNSVILLILSHTSKTQTWKHSKHIYKQ